MTASDLDIRDSILSTLSFLASVEEQKAFAEKVEYDDYEGEFACWWFDTFYPDDPRATVMFDTEQITSLQEFSATFEMSHAVLKNELFSIDKLLASCEWQVVVAKARETLDKVNRDF